MSEKLQLHVNRLNCFEQQKKHNDLFSLKVFLQCVAILRIQFKGTARHCCQWALNRPFTNYLQPGSAHLEPVTTTPLTPISEALYFFVQQRTRVAILAHKLEPLVLFLMKDVNRGSSKHCVTFHPLSLWKKAQSRAPS